ncbi:MAG TPA: hypothetical protein VJ914_04185 [Pseudonocardiaceae bacterium]|nr:hypothetical protein [Pseudonocardiaceae bacterium]
MKEPTPEEAAAALRAVHEGREQVIKSVTGSPRWLWIFSGLYVFAYCTITDLFPRIGPWANLGMLAILLVFVFALRTRKGSALLGRPVVVSGRSIPISLKWRLVRVVPILATGIVAAVLIGLFHVPHGAIYYGALAGLYIIFLGPRFQLWLLRRQEKD